MDSTTIQMMCTLYMDIMYASDNIEYNSFSSIKEKPSQSFSMALPFKVA